MGTFLFHDIIYGPVKSRRLGISLGINLLPTQSKWCNYDCIYCECGWSLSGESHFRVHLPERKQVVLDLEKTLQKMRKQGVIPDVLTFAGNGEPTMHPEFPEIIEDTLVLRDQYCPSAKISVLTNATGLDKPSVLEALQRVDQSILKLDSGLSETYFRLNRPKKKLAPAEMARKFQRLGGKEIIQTLFLKGMLPDGPIDNTTPEELDAWEALVVEVRPSQVMIYTIDRDTPAEQLEKIPREQLEIIAERIRKHGIPVQVSA